MKEQFMKVGLQIDTTASMKCYRDGMHDGMKATLTDVKLKIGSLVQ